MNRRPDRAILLQREQARTPKGLLIILLISDQKLRLVTLTCRFSLVPEVAGQEVVPSQGQEENDLSDLKDAVLPRKKTPLEALQLSHLNASSPFSGAHQAVPLTCPGLSDPSKPGR